MRSKENIRRSEDDLLSAAGIVDSESGPLGMFRFCINQAPEAVFWMNRKAGFTYVNEQACRSLDYIRKASVAVGTETILLVEDDRMVRRMIKTMLTKIGYTVLDAESPLRALYLCEKKETPIDLLITDVVMPEMSGPELRQKIQAVRPEVKVVFISGYTPDVIVQHGILKEGAHFVQKPFAMNDLAQTVRNAIGDQMD